MTHEPHLITIERWTPHRPQAPSRPKPPYEFGIWHVPGTLDLDHHLRIQFTRRPAGSIEDMGAYHSALNDEWVADLGVIVRKEGKRIWTRAELGSKAFSKLRRMATYGQWMERKAYVTGHSTLFVNYKHAGLTFRYRPDQLQEKGYSLD